MYSKSVISTIFLVILFLGGCSDKEESVKEEFNKPAIFWYKQMVDNIKADDLEAADDTFASLQSEHIYSPLLPEAMLILAKAHMQNEEYLLAEFYYDEFIKRFGDEDNIDFVEHMKIKSNFFSFRLKNRDQKLLLRTIEDAEKFIVAHPYSRYRPIVDSMLLKMHLANLELNQEIAALYERVDKPEAAKIYGEKLAYGWLKEIVYEDKDLEWYRQLFDW